MSGRSVRLTPHAAAGVMNVHLDDEAIGSVRLYGGHGEHGGVWFAHHGDVAERSDSAADAVVKVINAHDANSERS
jgi:hypothetical protein